MPITLEQFLLESSRRAVLDERKARHAALEIAERAKIEAPVTPLAIQRVLQAKWFQRNDGSHYLAADGMAQNFADVEVTEPAIESLKRQVREIDSSMVVDEFENKLTPRQLSELVLAVARLGGATDADIEAMPRKSAARTSLELERRQTQRRQARKALTDQLPPGIEV